MSEKLQKAEQAIKGQAVKKSIKKVEAGLGKIVEDAKPGIDKKVLIIVSAKADLSFPNVSIGNPVMCYSEHRFRLKACRNDIVLAETMIKADKKMNQEIAKRIKNFN